MKNIKYLLLVFCLLLGGSCKLTQKSSVPRNLERIYDPLSLDIHPHIGIYNTSDSGSIINIKLYTNELLYNQANEENKLMARIKIIYNLYDLNEKQKLTDSLTTTFQFEKNGEKKYELIKIRVNAKKGNDYFIEIITTDQNRKNTHYAFKRLDRTNTVNYHDFLVYDKRNNGVIPDPYIREGIPFGIKYYKKELDSLQVLFYSNIQEIPPPANVADTVQANIRKADTSWICYTDSINYSNYCNEGIYYFSQEFPPEGEIDKELNGLALYNFGNTFPNVQTPDDLIKPLIYLGLSDTISKLDTTGKFTKLAVDNFWLDRANNIERSRELVKLFYTRVMYANKYFTSYKEGWQSDRGMIYIIYGLPDYLFKSGIEERWIYSPTDLGPGISFTFNYSEAPFTYNHYVLKREKLNATGWSEAVKMWMSGEVFYYQR